MARMKEGRRPIGRPLKYETPEAMQAAIDKYFESCKGAPFKNEKGEVIFNKFGDVVILGAMPPTITGLALALGFTSRQDILNYGEREPFYDTVNAARQKIMAYAESRLYDRDGGKGAEFWLRCNSSWIAEDTKRNLDIQERAVKVQETKLAGVQDSVDKINEGIQSLAALLRAPQPNRKIEAFENDE